MEKIVKLCNQCGSCCPSVRITADRVEIGEDNNLCVLTTDQWEILRQKILSGEFIEEPT